MQYEILKKLEILAEYDTPVTIYEVRSEDMLYTKTGLPHKRLWIKLIKQICVEDIGMYHNIIGYREDINARLNSKIADPSVERWEDFECLPEHGTHVFTIIHFSEPEINPRARRR